MDTIELKLSQQDIAIIYQALGELPLKIAGPVFSKLQAQIQERERAEANK